MTFMGIGLRWRGVERCGSEGFGGFDFSFFKFVAATVFLSREFDVAGAVLVELFLLTIDTVRHCCGLGTSRKVCCAVDGEV